MAGKQLESATTKQFAKMMIMDANY